MLDTLRRLLTVVGDRRHGTADILTGALYQPGNAVEPFGPAHALLSGESQNLFLAQLQQIPGQAPPR